MQDPTRDDIARSYDQAKATYAAWGVDTEAALTALTSVPL